MERVQIETKIVLEESYEKKVLSFLKKSKENTSDTFVFIFSKNSTIKIRENYRTSNLALDFINKDTPVIYSYSSNCPNYMKLTNDANNDLLFETAIDKTLEYILKIIRYDLKVKNKIFIIDFPSKDIIKYIEVFKFYGWKVIYDILDKNKDINEENIYKKNHELYIIETSDIIVARKYEMIEGFNKITNRDIILLNSFSHENINDNRCLKNIFKYILKVLNKNILNIRNILFKSKKCYKANIILELVNK